MVEIGLTGSAANTHRITVAHVVTHLRVGGLERIVVNLIRGIDHKRFRSVLCCTQREGDWAQEVRDSCEAVVAMGKRQGVTYGLPFRLARVFRAERVDVVHCHNFGPFVYGSIGGRIARCRAIVYTVHGPAAPSKWRQVCFQRLPLADHVVAVSDHVRQGILERLRLDPQRVTTIVNGIDVERFAAGGNGRTIRSELGVRENAPLCGIVARLTPEKDYDTLLRAFARIVSQYPAARLVVVGDGELRNNLEVTAADLKVLDSIDFLGSREDVPEILAGLDVFVLPSREEGLGIALLEAMAAGLPVVATAVGGIPEVVVDRTTGLLVPPDDPQKLADAVIWLLINRETARRMGQEGRKRVAERFGVSQMVRAYERIYAGLFSGRDNNGTDVPS